MAESPKMLMEKEGPLGWITFNQPEKRNAVSQEMWQMVPDIVKDLEDDGKIRVIILRGAGDQAFMAGADISQLLRLTVGSRCQSLEYQGVAASPLAGCALNCTGFACASFRVASCRSPGLTM